ncbi:MAG: hypothetical protein ACOX6T_03620 [Myxococcales bacterium]|jgi:hypothetical protein
MSKTLLALAAFLAVPAVASAAPQTGRAWGYANLTTVVSPNLSLTLMPGVRYEYLRADADAKGRYLDELFVGPNFSARFGDLTVKASLWYYFTGYPTASAHAHNLEVIPALEYRLGRLSLLYRLILHNTFYASVYEDSAHRSGYGLVARNLFQARFAATPQVGIILGVEPFHGVIEDAEAPAHSLGYWQRGLRLNRVYAGFDWKPIPELGVSPQYVLESALDKDGNLAETGHYVFLTISYLWRPFEK